MDDERRTGQADQSSGNPAPYPRSAPLVRSALFAPFASLRALRGPSAASVRLAVSWVRAPSTLWVPADALPDVEPAAPITPTTPSDTEAPLEDLQLLGLPGGDDAARLAALERVIRRISWIPRDPRARRALAERAAADGRSLETTRAAELRAAVYLVLAERGRPQTHRFGRLWPTGPDSHQVEIVPERLPPTHFWRWFVDEVRKAAEASVLGLAYPVSRSESVWSAADRRVAVDESDLDRYPGTAPDPLLVVLDRERQDEIALGWKAVMDRVTPGQRELLRALRDAREQRPSATLADAARRVNLAPSTARVQWKRLLQRVRPSES